MAVRGDSNNANQVGTYSRKANGEVTNISFIVIDFQNDFFVGDCFGEKF
jgi:hypothetical protein